LSEAIQAHQNTGISNERKYYLLADKLYRLIQRNRMADISLETLRDTIEKASKSGDFNLYQFVKKFL
jgi:LAO/AO transport system kinase